MRPLGAFAIGIAAGGALTALVLGQAKRVDDDALSVESWRDRAGEAEGELTATRRQLAGATAQLEALRRRFDELSARFEELSAVAANPPGAPGNAGAQTAPAAAAPTAAAVAPAPPAPPEFQPVDAEQWEALVRGTLQSEIERRLGGALPPAREQRLMDQLERLRDASRSLVEENLAPTDAERGRQEVMRSIVLMQADRVFHEELGVGVAEFLRGLDAAHVEEIPPGAPTAP